MGGLKYEDLPSTLTLPTYFVPFDVDNNIIDFSKRYECKNHLNEELDNILNRNQSNFFPVINQFRSPNPKKTHFAEPLNRTHFRRSATVLQISRLYNPTSSNFMNSVLIRTLSSLARARL